MKNVAIFISGRGSNLQALIEHKDNNFVDSYNIRLVVANKECAGLEYACNANIPHIIIPTKGRTIEDFENDVQLILTNCNINIIVLAGFMKILTASFISKWENKIINIHPSLLPSFKGLHTHERAIECGVKYHGCTVHFVTPGLDEGSIIAQNIVVVRQDDTPDTLAHRVLFCEHVLLPYCLDIVCRDAYIIEGRKIILL